MKTGLLQRLAPSLSAIPKSSSSRTHVTLGRKPSESRAGNTRLISKPEGGLEQVILGDDQEAGELFFQSPFSGSNDALNTGHGPCIARKPSGKRNSY